MVKVDAVIGRAVLGEVAGADFLVAVASADLVATRGGHLGSLLFVYIPLSQIACKTRPGFA
jgi:hypothetical protein